jgi:hypothetical protein
MPIKNMKVRIAAACMLLLAVFTQGCIQDDLSDCGIGVQFRYIKNVDGIDKFSTAVNHITLFVFDADERYIGSFSSAEGETANDGYMMNLPLRAGSYKLIAWGNLDDCYTLTECVPGETMMQEFMLKLNHTNDSITEFPTHLFYGGVQDITIPEEGTQYVLIDLTKDTNTIYATVSVTVIGGGESANIRNYSCKITSINGEYNYDNSTTGPRLTYIPQYRDSTENTFLADYVIMRELNDGLTAPRLIITDERTGDVKDERNLTDLLLGGAKSGDLDIDDVFYIKVDVSYDAINDPTNVSVTITVNGYVVVENETGHVIG